MYTDSSLQVPWYFIPGNHDYYGNVSAQIEYSAHSSRWMFPSLYYLRSFTANDGSTLDIIFIDTIDLSGSNGIVEESHPRYFDKLPYKKRNEAADQWAWIEESLSSSTANHIIVAGHYPMYSVCEHGPTQNLLDNLRPLLVKYHAHYISGHDHCMYVGCSFGVSRKTCLFNDYALFCIRFFVHCTGTHI